VAFVYQDDSFFSMLTVEETLKLTANLRMLNHSEAERNRAVDEVVSAMALGAVLGTKVGDATGTRGISGGERKRLAVACELLSNPLLLVADEPTSGLDSYQAFSVVNQLKNAVLANGIAGVITLHQPRSSIWALLDDIILLASNGRLVYQGRRDKAVEHFSKLGFPCPVNTNPAEHLIDLVSIDHTNQAARMSSTERIEKLVKAFSEKQSPSKHKTNAFATIQSPVSPKHSRGLAASVLRGGSQLIHRFGLLLRRAIRQTIRDGGVNIVRFGVSSLLAMVVGTVYGKMAGPLIDEDSIGDRITIIAQAAIQVSMLAMLKTLQLFKRERVVVSREIATRQYGSLEYLISKSFAELPIDALVAALFGVVLHHRANLRCSRNDFVGTLALLGCASSSLGLAISALSPTGEIALALGPALMVVYVITGSIGPGKAKVDVSWMLRALRNASPIRPACEALCVAEFANQSFTSSKHCVDKKNAVVRVCLLALKFSSRIWRSLWHRGLPGNIVLQDLGIKDITPSSGKQSLTHLLIGHSVLAFVGLLVTHVGQ